MATMKFVHPPIDFEKLNKELLKSEFKTPLKGEAFREGWIAAIISLGHFESPEVSPEDSQERGP